MSQPTTQPTTVERVNERELKVTRLFDAPRARVFRAWSEAGLFRQWWMPKSATGVALVGCDMDVRTGGGYRLEFRMGEQTMAFFGKYLEVVPNEKIVWTNDEEQDGEGAVTTVQFEDRGGQTLLTFHERYPDAAALEEAMTGSAAGLPEQLDQLEAMLATA